MSSRSKSKATAFSHTLMPTLRIDDQQWTFDIPMPSPEELDRQNLVKKVVLCTDMRQWKHTMVLKIEPIQVNRAMKGDALNRFLLISLEGFRPLGRLEGQAGGAAQDAVVGLQPATWKDCTEYAIRLLRSGISIHGVTYHFYGHSNSQLKSRTCFLYAASKEEISRKVEALGDFRKMKTVGKKAKRIGLLFSVARVAMVVSPERCQDIADIETPDYVFTDGCGLISPNLAKELARRVQIMFREMRYTPSVFQIRYRGYKGVVTVDPRMLKGKTLLQLRKSMNKFSGGDDHSFAAVDYSKPYTYGFLNDESIILLEALGVPRSIMLMKQEHHFRLLADARMDFRAAFRFLSYVNRPDLAEHLLMDGIDALRPQINKLINSEHSEMLNKREEQKCRIFVPQSRLLFGVCDAWDVLREGECAVKVTTEGNGQPYTLKGTEVSVIRNPCLHPGDWQKFKVVEKPELAHLVDCIVFSTRGRRPAADLMSGGDLDGDRFFVCWDKDLIPSTLAQPASYPGGRDPVRFKPITDDDRLVYFAKYTNASLGQVKNLYMEWARVQGPMSPECQELNRLFSQCVDGNRIRIPERLKSTPQPGTDAIPFVLDELHEAAKKLIQGINLPREGMDGYTVDDYGSLYNSLLEMDERTCLLRSFDWLFRNIGRLRVEPGALLRGMIDFLTRAPFLAISFGRLTTEEALREDLTTFITVHTLPILRAFILSANEAGELIVAPFKSMLGKVSDHSISLREVAGLVELISLTVRSSELGLDLLLECLEKESLRIVSGQQEVIRRSVSNLTGIALDHIAEASEQKKSRDNFMELKKLPDDADGFPIVEVSFRIDAPPAGRLRIPPTSA